MFREAKFSSKTSNFNGFKESPPHSEMYCWKSAFYTYTVSDPYSAPADINSQASESVIGASLAEELNLHRAGTRDVGLKEPESDFYSQLI